MTSIWTNPNKDLFMPVFNCYSKHRSNIIVFITDNFSVIVYCFSLEKCELVNNCSDPMSTFWKQFYMYISNTSYRHTARPLSGIYLQKTMCDIYVIFNKSSLILWCIDFMRFMWESKKSLFSHLSSDTYSSLITHDNAS